MRACLFLLFALAVAAAEPAPGPPAVHGESVVQPARRPYHKVLREGSGANADDACLLLAMQQNGYDHHTPTAYRQAIVATLARLCGLDPASLDLPVLALTTTALAGAHALAEDPTVWQRAEVCLANLRTRWPAELPRWLGRSGAFAGPESAVLVMQALLACQAAGLAVGDDPAGLRALDFGQGEAADLARAYCRAWTGGQPAASDPAVVQRWQDSFERWWTAGRIELIRTAVLVVYRDGGPAWPSFSGAWRDRLAALRLPGDHAGGGWPLDHHPLGRLYGSAQVLLCLGYLSRPAWTVQAKPPPAGTPANPPGDF